jgi:adenine-specific DNA-methyltransferase
MAAVDLSEVIPNKNESPVEYANRTGELYASTTTDKFKKENGQFFTPPAIAEFIAGQISINDALQSVSILDPGCGMAILSCAAVEKISESRSLRNIELAVYETDLNLAPHIEKVLAHLKKWAKKREIDLMYTINSNDYILENYVYLDQQQLSASGKYDIIISNPPYFKLGKEDKQIKAVQGFIDGQSNIYSVFMAIAAAMLSINGRMVFIVPRSFASGRYFRSFRDFLLKKVDIDFIHLFNTRKETFSKDKVLQETIVVKCTNAEVKDGRNTLVVSYSEGVKDLDSTTRKEYVQNELIDMQSKEKIFHLPANTKEDAIINLFKSWSGSLNKYDIQISTGPVVAFRTSNHISDESGEEMAPLFWLHNVVKMLTDHPVKKNGRKQFIRISRETMSILLPNKNYILLRRFSSKDDKSRLIAAPYFCNTSHARFIGVENKLNYIYRPNGHLERAEVMGLAALLDSDIFDIYFRTFNGNVNVSATELREMPMPPLETIKNIGKELILKNDFSLKNVSEIMNTFFQI